MRVVVFPEDFHFGGGVVFQNHHAVGTDHADHGVGWHPFRAGGPGGRREGEGEEGGEESFHVGEVVYGFLKVVGYLEGLR